MAASGLRAKFRQRKSIPVLVLSLAAIAFLIRGPFRALTGSDLNDLISPYVQSLAFIRGADPYSPQSLLENWPKQALACRPEEREFEDGSILVRHGIPTAYPLTAFLLIAPLTFLPWPAFKCLAVILSVLLFVAAVWSLAVVTKIEGFERFVFLCLSLLFAPFHTGIAVSNPAVIATELGLISLWADEAAPIASGLLVAISTGLKPQIGLCFLVFYVMRRRRIVAATAVATALVLSVAPLVRLAVGNAPWFLSYKLDNYALFRGGILGDFTDRNPLRFGLVNLQVALFPLLHDREATNAIALLVSMLLLAAWVVLSRRMQSRDELLSLSALVAVALLPIYHRFYDATLLILPLCWFLTRARHGFGKNLMIGSIALAAFFVPGGSLLETLSGRGIIPTVLSQENWWNSMIMAHASWCVLALSLVLLYQMGQAGLEPPIKQA